VWAAGAGTPSCNGGRGSVLGELVGGGSKASSRGAKSSSSSIGGSSIISAGKGTPLAAILRAPLPVYHSRLLREDKAALVRLRCVGAAGLRRCVRHQPLSVLPCKRIYHSRLLREDKAALVRLRCVGAAGLRRCVRHQPPCMLPCKCAHPC